MDKNIAKKIFNYKTIDKKIKKYIISWLKNLKIEKGFSENTPVKFQNEESCIVPNIDITERKEYVTNNMRGQKYKKY